jgi:hypothetical protein
MPFIAVVAGALVLFFVGLATHRAYRNFIPNDYSLFEHNLRRRLDSVGRKQEYFFGNEEVPRYQLPFVRASLYSLNSKGELGSTIVYYKNGRVCQGAAFEAEKDHFEEACEHALKRHQGRHEMISHLRPLAPYDYCEETFFRKAARQSLDVSF